MTTSGKPVRVADEAWLALALLHVEHLDRTSFTVKEILDRVKTEQVHPELRPGVQVHIYSHNVANTEPNSGKYRLFYKLSDDTYRLFRQGDVAHPARKGKTMPERSEIPEKYHHLLDWYKREYCARQPVINEEDDPILQMLGVGKEIWADTNADDYVRDLRANWYGAQHATK